MYKVGFTAGTFDMLHIGHLNLLSRAKERCEYLIVGVNSDDLVRSYKKKDPIISIGDRTALVEALKVVDRVVIINTLDKVEAWKRFKFNVVFIGDDWKGHTRWIQTEEDLKKVNVTVCYLPYTKGISSTELVEIINTKKTS